MAYRSVVFRDYVLWPLAYALGLDPSQELLVDQANALTSYINNWVRKGWDATDTPEWTLIQTFTPDSNHMVPYPLTASLADTPIPGPSALPSIISRVFKVYLLDPHVSQGSYDTPFRLLSEGIHCGFEHGSGVWIRFIANPPQFNANQWDSTVTYQIGNESYSPVTGQCYASVSPSNLNHDPSTDTGSNWVVVPFPFALVDYVLRGAYADCLKEWGQNEKSQESTQLALQEGQARMATFLAPVTDKLTDQTQSKPRYTVP